MPAVVKVIVDRAGVGRMLKSSEFAGMVGGAAVDVAAAVESRLAAVEPAAAGTVEIQHYTTDRAAAAVDVKYVTAVGLQAKYGILTGAAGDVGIPLGTHNG